MAKLVLEGNAVEAEEGANLVEVAGENGVYIPTLCYLKGEPCIGTCRVCSVRVNGNITAACSVAVSDGMEVQVSEPEVSDMRRALVEALFSEGNHNCPSCEKSGRCELQAVGYETGMVVSRFPYRYPPRDRDVGAKRLWLERDRCIFCQRCVEHIRDRNSGHKIFSINGRGSRARIEIDVELADRMPPEQVREAMDICPVGCILEKRVGFDVPMGERKFEVQTHRERATGVSSDE